MRLRMRNSVKTLPDLSPSARDGSPDVMPVTLVCDSFMLQIMYDYLGRTPPFGENIMCAAANNHPDARRYRPGAGRVQQLMQTHLPRSFLEDVYCRRDPFSAQPRPLNVGGKCSLCDRTVCAGKCVPSRLSLALALMSCEIRSGSNCSAEGVIIVACALSYAGHAQFSTPSGSACNAPRGTWTPSLPR